MKALFLRVWTENFKRRGALRGAMRRVLVVDNDRDALVSIANVLHAEFPHLEVRVAATRDAALALAAQERFDLVLASDGLATDLGLPTAIFRKPVDPEHLLDVVRGGRS